jgi:hypothetical protein
MNTGAREHALSVAAFFLAFIRLACGTPLPPRGCVCAGMIGVMHRGS